VSHERCGHSIHEQSIGWMMRPLKEVRECLRCIIDKPVDETARERKLDLGGVDVEIGQRTAIDQS
jgi:hypothetical protein